MRKSSFLNALSFTAAMVLIGLRSPPQNTTQQQKKRGAGGDEAQGNDASRPSRDFTALIDTISREALANRQEERREDRGKRFREYLTLFIVAVTAGGILYQAWIFSGQLDEMRGASIQTNKIIGANSTLAEAAGKQAAAAELQAKALADNARVAREALIASQRAWIGPRNAKIESPLEIEKAIEIGVEYANSGREPGQNFTYAVDAFPSTVTDEITGVSLSRINQYLAACRIQPATAGQVVFPATGFASNNLSVKPKEITIDQPILDGTKTIFVQGCFTYRTFEVIRHTYFCYYFRGKVTKPDALNICLQGHYAD